ncbi:hypothetical protein GCM10007094_39990 [Pseudovibrio japonicus]|uniref:DUF4386 family protein n=1 Tax=Pseudovibrio japonicus TaxID=366534 RepID=A0ABQ3ERL3_9HYPH|nr:DUF4386 family protein [Pseudovibrio japonicus]GHB46674.1 hypothetical protein GCM10007094_39990 [Pseudovibrio japonicus]
MTLQKTGGVASLIAAATYIVGFALLSTLLVEAGAGEDGDDVNMFAFEMSNQGLMYLWNFIIYIVNAVFLVVLVVALHDRLKGAAPGLSQIAAAFGLIWAGLVLASGMLANISLAEVSALYELDQDRALAMWATLGNVQEGIGGGNEITGGLWVLLLCWAGLRGASLSKGLSWLGILIGLAGLVTVIPGMSEPGGIIFGLGFIVWFIWAGVYLLRHGEASA